jgi:hypothetical protein
MGKCHICRASVSVARASEASTRAGLRARCDSSLRGSRLFRCGWPTLRSFEECIRRVSDIQDGRGIR